jgi:predicted nucleic acid-binding protein
VDTNVLVFDTFEDSEFHDEAAALLDSMEKWCIPDMSLHEFLWFFKGRDLPLSQARTKVDEYLANEKSTIVSCSPDDIRFATRLMKRYHEYNDLVILSVAKRMGLPLFSFDQALKKLAAKNSVGIFERRSLEKAGEANETSRGGENREA